MLAEERDLPDAVLGEDSDGDPVMEEGFSRPALRVVDGRIKPNASPHARSLGTWTKLLAEIAEDVARLEARVEQCTLPAQETELPRVPPAKPRSTVPLRIVHSDDEETRLLFDDEGIEEDEIATVTLAEIYASQGYVKKAVRMMEEVLRRSSKEDRPLERRIEVLRRRLSDMEEG